MFLLAHVHERRCRFCTLFQKKAKHGIATPKSDLDLIKQRLQRAIEIDRELEA